MRRLPSFFILCALAAGCGSSSSIDTTDQDSGDDASFDSVADTHVDAPTDTHSNDSSTKDASDTAIDTGIGDDTSVDSTPTDSGSIDAGTDVTPIDAAPDVIFVDVPVFDGGPGCGPGGTCGTPLSCCGDKCVYERNDPHNCGGCGIECTGATSMCEGGHCIAPTCSPACASGSICCDVPGPGPSRPPSCYPGDSCPIGCPLCF